MIFLIIDFLLSYFSLSPTYFILLNFVLTPKNQIFKLIILFLILDLLILNTYFLNTIILTIIFFLYKKLPIYHNNLKNYMLSLSFILILYLFFIGLLNKFSFLYLIIFILRNYFLNLLFYLLSYKLLKKRIKLAR